MFDTHGVSFVSVTQSFNTTTSMGRLTLNVLLSFAQFEREVTGERIRDKIAASKKKGIWMGGVVPLGYRVEARALHIVEDHAELVRGLFKRYLEVGSVPRLKERLDASALTARGDRRAAVSSAEGISTRSSPTRSISARSPIRASFMKGSILPSSIASFGTRSSRAWRAISPPKASGAIDNRQTPSWSASCSTTGAT
jgi:hypothetical protein